jgi:hypothetical protein
MTAKIMLTPVQQVAADGLGEAIAYGGVLVLRGRAGSGKTTILQWLHGSCGGALLDTAHFLRAVGHGAPNAIEESFLRMVEETVQQHDLVFVDDLHLVATVVQDYNSPRSHLLDAALTAILAEAAVRKKTLVFAVEDEAPFPIQRRATVWEIGDFTPRTTPASSVNSPRRRRRTQAVSTASRPH